VTPRRMHVPPKATRHAFSAALVLIGVLALYNQVLAPHLGYLHAMQRFGAVVDRVAEERDRISSTLDAKVSQWHALQHELTGLDEGVFTADDAKAFVRGLLPLVEETGCVVVLADFAGPGKADRVEEPNQPVVIEASHVNLVVRGQVDTLSLLLQRLGDHRPKIWIDSCQCDFAEGGARQAECSLALTLYAAQDRLEPAGK